MQILTLWEVNTQIYLPGKVMSIRSLPGIGKEHRTVYSSTWQCQYLPYYYFKDNKQVNSSIFTFLLKNNTTNKEGICLWRINILFDFKCKIYFKSCGLCLDGVDDAALGDPHSAYELTFNIPNSVPLIFLDQYFTMYLCFYMCLYVCLTMLL